MLIGVYNFISKDINIVRDSVFILHFYLNDEFMTNFNQSEP